MRKFAIIIPEGAVFNDPASIGAYGVSVLDYVRDWLVKDVNGYTESKAKGAWRAKDNFVLIEKVRRFDFASSTYKVEDLQSMARFLTIHTAEVCYYVEHDGEAHIYGDL